MSVDWTVSEIQPITTSDLQCVVMKILGELELPDAVVEGSQDDYEDWFAIRGLGNFKDEIFLDSGEFPRWIEIWNWSDPVAHDGDSRILVSTRGMDRYTNELAVKIQESLADKLNGMAEPWS